MKNPLFLFLLVFFFIPQVYTQSLERNIALLDLSEANQESNDSRLFSAEHMLKVAGIPFEVIQDPMEAMEHAVILISSQIIGDSFTEAEIAAMESYVFSGGILIAPRVLEEDWFDLFGIGSFTASKTNYHLDWSNSISTDLFRWMDEAEEQRIVFGEDDGGDIFNTYEYEIIDALPLGHYENGGVGVAQNQFGNGFTYAFGVSWRDVILRSQLNRDYEAERITSNGFEPTQDVLILLMRAIFCEHVPYTTWKHTSPNNSTSTLMVSHDVDSRTGMDSMLLFAESEKEMDIRATYNITLRYFSDALMSDFYNGNVDKVASVIGQGHRIGSHSVGHFPDFADSNIFPFGNPGNTMANYTPYYDGAKTTGASVFAECEVSKNVLEADHNLTIRSFRAGHLAFNNKLVDVLDSLGYEYNSSNSASDVLTHFPYQNKKGRSFNGATSKVYEFGVSISDVFHDDPITEDNYLEKADQWLEVHNKIDANNGATVLLIHPNRGYKLKGQEYFLSQISETVYVTEMNEYGDYWKAREAFDYETEIINNTLYIRFPSQSLLLDEGISLIINDGQDLDQVVALDEQDQLVDFVLEDWEDNDLVLYRNSGVVTSTVSAMSSGIIKLYPNPLKDQLNIDLTLGKAALVDIQIFDLLGRRLFQNTDAFQVGFQHLQLDFSKLKITSGTYLCKIDAGVNGVYWQKLALF